MSQRSIAIVLLILVTGALVVAATALLVRDKNPVPIQVLPPGAKVENPPVATTSPTFLPTPPAADLRVHIAGAVAHPGVYVLQPGDRLVDALELAGGATAEADLDAVNLAQPLRDAEQYYIPKVSDGRPAIVAATPEATPDQGSEGTPSGSGRIDLNDATVDLLVTLPGIGPAKAQAIVAYREQNGPFASVAEITEVSGIGPATYDGIKDLVTVGP